MKLDTLLDQYGIPPPEVCVDWALQIRRLIKDAGNAHVDTEIDRDLNHIWQRLDADDNGVLTVNAPLSSAELKFASEALGTWCEQTLQEDPSRFPGLRELLRAASRTDVSEMVPVANAGIGQRDSSASHRKTISASVERRSQSHSRNRIGVVAAILFLSAICVLAIVTTGRLTRRVAGELASAKSSQTADVDTSATDSHPPTTIQTGQIRIDSNAQNTELTNSTDVIDSSDRGATGQVLTTDGLLSDALLAPATIEPSVTSPMNATQDSADAEMASKKSTSESTPSVLSEIQSTLEQAEKEIQEAELRQSPVGPMPTSTKNPTTTLRPFVLELQSMRVSLKLHKILATVPKEPVWRLRLTAVDGFAVSPLAEQTLDSRGLIAWSVQEESAEAPRTKVIVQARQAGGRKGDLVWRVFGTADDIPSLVLPLNRKWLDPLHANLRLYAQSLLITQDQLLQQSRQPSLPSNIRAALSNRRQWASQQSKLLDRSTSVIAEVNRLVGLLDKQFEITGELVDGNVVDAPVFLRWSDDGLP